MSATKQPRKQERDTSGMLTRELASARLRGHPRTPVASKAGTSALLLVLSGACVSTSAPPPPRVIPARVTASVSTSAVASATPEIPAPEPIATFKDDEGIPIAPGPAGHLGAWLALGPFRLDDPSVALPSFRPPIRDENGKADGTTLDDQALKPGAAVAARVDVYDPKKSKWGTAPAAWTAASSGEGAIDLEKVFGSRGKPAVAYLGGVLRVPKAKRMLLLVGSDDGCEVLVDGKSIFVRDVSRPQRDDDDLIPLDLEAGDHTVLFKLKQRDGGWAIRVRLVDRTFAAPHGVRLLLPGVGDDVGRMLAKSMSWVRLIREPTAQGYSIATLIRYPEGAPLRPAIEARGGVLDVLDTRPLGTLAITPRGTAELRASIGELPAMTEDAGKTLTVRVDVAGRVVDGSLAPRKVVRDALLRARAFLAKNDKVDDIRATIEHLETRLTQQVTRGDLDTTAQLADAKFLDAFVADAELSIDPIAKRTGVMRLAHIARADDKPQAIGVYVPKTTKKVPLYVGLHGMNGGPMSMMRVFFGGDDEKKSMGELERSLGSGPIPPIDAFVIAPHGHGNAMYRQLGEEEVMDAIAWARSRWSNIDPDRIYITGFSMGGIGAASIPFHHPDFFAAAQPLCGYHSYFIRRDVAGRPRRPWEQYLVEDRSNVSWVDNGARLPLWIIHGIRDLPEENSGVLIEAYEKKGFSIKHDHPDLGHDVWGFAYDKMQHVSWFSGKKRNAHPKQVRFRTTRPRFGDDAWVHLDQMSSPAEWATIDAKIGDGNKISVSTKGIDAFHLDRDPALLKEGPVTVTIDGTSISELSAHRENGAWVAGPPKDEGARKSGKITGPIRDVWNDPLTVVYGTEDDTQTAVNLEVARAFATIRWGVDVSYPILRDVDVDPAAMPTKATIVVGNAKGNRLLRALEPSLPIKVDDKGIAFAGKTFTGSQVGAAFVVPHPKAPDQYLLVIEGVDALGTFRALSLPELLPDFVIYDERLGPARGQSLLGFGSVLAAGYFDNKWQPPKSFEDPLIKLPSAKSEKDATPYLP
jgi:predicted esterase